MRLTPGSRIGAYEIVALIGAGGMGEVYRARDAKLQRDVAIKVLPEAFASDPERLARFEREARTLAALNDRHIAQIYGVEDRALVMEFVAGDDLAQRLSTRGAVPLEDALALALQIAAALECAHEHGIVHRDLKPANIKVTPDGTVKVLDFGLARALDPGGPRGNADLANSPTITSPFALSNLGVILGTAAYMAPEQARGKPLDKRVDIWAFGCVLYEMLTAKRAFPGEDVTDTLGAIMRADPDWSALPRETPESIRVLLRRCLAKDPRERLPDIGAARLELKDASSAASVPAAAVQRMARERSRWWWPAVIAAVMVPIAAIAITALYVVTSREQPPARPLTLMMMPPAPLAGAPALRFAISPNGTKLAFVARDESGTPQLWVRALDSAKAQALPGTERASAPFWSPDSRSIAFIADGRLRRVDADGGPVMTLAPATTAPAGAWNADDVIVFSGRRGPLTRVSARGPGTPEPVTEMTGGINEKIHILPSFLPDGRHFVYTSGTGGARAAGIFVGSLDDKKTTMLLPGASHAAYANGHLLYLRDTTLVAQPFDAGALRFSGEPIPIATDVQINTSTGTGAFSVSNSGVLVYQTGPSSGTRLLWLDRSGNVKESLGEGRWGYQDVRLSPNEKMVSVTLMDPRGQSDIWLFDLDRAGLPRRLTFDGASLDAVWSPDSARVVYASRRLKPTHDLFERAAAGTGAEAVVLSDDTDKYPLGFGPGGASLLYEIPTGAASGNAWLLPLSGPRTPRPIKVADDSEVPMEVSPDGRWVAYVGDASGSREVFVTSFPDGSGKWQISNGGGENPRWRRDGKELFYTAPDAFFAVDVDTTAAQFVSGAPRRQFYVRVPAPQLGTRSTYAATRDGQRFLFNMWDPAFATLPLTVVVNWPATIRR